MHNKGVIWETLSHVLLAGFIIFIGFGIIYIDTRIVEAKRSDFFQERMFRINDDDIFIGFLLKTNENGVSLQNLIVDPNRRSNKREITEKINTMLDSAYSEEMCWHLFINDDEWISEKKCREFENPLVDSTIISPSDDGPLKINFFIPGSAK